MTRRYVILGAVILMTGCRASNMGKIEQFVSPDINASTLQRITVIADGPSRSDVQVTARARDRLTRAGLSLVKRAGSWETDTQAAREICVQNPASVDNVDGVVFVGWNHVTLHDCATAKIATRVSGNYAGVDAMVDRLLKYLGRTPPEN